jgi:transcription antitermination factor NusG
VASVLSGKGYQPYLPMYTVSRRRIDRTVITEYPLFPGYLFCRFDPIKRLPILTSTGVLSVLGFGSEPAAIPNSEIDAVKAVLESGLGVSPCPFLKEGQRVRVIDGSLEGLEGILVRIKSELRLVVSVNMLQRSVSVEIDRNYVVPA